MKKFIFIIFLCCNSISAMEQQPREIFIHRAQEKHISGLIALSNEVRDDFFRPTMTKTFSKYSSSTTMESVDTFLNKADIFFKNFFEKATSNLENNNDNVVIASTNEEPDKILGLCAFTKEENSIFVQYLILSQQVRSKGIGKALLQHALAMYKDIAFCRLVTLAYGNEAAQAFYEKFGFTSTKELCSAAACLPKAHFMYQLDIKK